MAADKLRVRVQTITREAEDISSYELVDPAGAPLPPFEAGAHVDVHVDRDDPAGRIRQFSLCNDPRESHRYVIAVLREEHGRGGSVAFHDTVSVGDLLPISVPRNNFPLEEGADQHLLIAGGIGITPILAMVRRLEVIDADYRLYYCTRTPKQTAFMDPLARPPFAGRVEIVHDNGIPEQGLDLRSLLATRPQGAHLYCCGPGGLMEAVKQAAAPAYPADAVHFEYFTAPPEADDVDNRPFQVKLQSTGETIDIPADRSILDVLRNDYGMDLESSCEEGICGTCATQLVAGEPDHRDHFLSEEIKAQNTWIMICCSRAKEGVLELGL